MTRAEVTLKVLDRLSLSSLPPSLHHLDGPLNRRVNEIVDLAKERAIRIALWDKKIFKLSDQLIWNDYAQSTRVKKRNELERLLKLWKSEQQ